MGYHQGRWVMVLTIGHITAACPLCGHTEFSCAHKHPAAQDVMTCGRCATKVTYVYLTRQIADKALAEAKASREANRGKQDNDP